MRPEPKNRSEAGKTAVDVSVNGPAAQEELS